MLFILFFVLSGCSKDQEDLRDSAIRNAMILLNAKDCKEAKAVLLDSGYYHYHADYLQRGQG